MCGVGGGAFRSSVLKLRGISESPGALDKAQTSVGLTIESYPRVSDSLGVGQGPIICTFNEFPDEAYSVGLGTKFGEPLV